MNDKTLYVVSGFMRTGTSMMMKALEAGGLEAYYDKDRDTMKDHFADEHYDPNIGGLYELKRSEYLAKNFPKEHSGKLIKAMAMAVPRMAVMKDGIRVVFMRRNVEEIRQSYAAFFGNQLANTDKLDDLLDDIIERIQNRKDVTSLDVFQYREVVEDPKAHFTVLKDHGWPIDVERSAGVVDPKHCRYRIENLTVGVV